MKQVIATICAFAMIISSAWAQDMVLRQGTKDLVVMDGIVPSGTNYTQDANCVGAWYMNVDGNETDRSANGNTLTETGGTIPTSATVPSGYSGKSRDFESGDTEYLTSADSSSLDINGADAKITICAWIKRESDSGGYETVVAKYDFGNNNRQYSLTITNTDKISLILSANGTSTSAAASSASIATGTWTHVAAVCDDVNIQMYINGTADGSATAFTSGIYNGSSPFSIGINFNNTSAGTDYFDGLIDEVGVFNRALSVDEISDIYTDGISGNKGVSD